MELTEAKGEPVFPCRVEGWLNVWEVDSHSQNVLFEDGCTPVPIWEPHFCVLLQDARRLGHFRTEKAADERPHVRPHALRQIRLDGGKEEFYKRWGYEALECIKENVMQQSHFAASLDAFSRSQTLDNRSISSQNSAYEREDSLAERRGSVPTVPVALAEDMDPPSTPSRIANFFTKRVKSNLKRTKSVTKLDRKKTGLNSDLEYGASTSKRPGSLKRTMSLGRLTKRWQKPRPTLTDDPSPLEGDMRWGALIASSRMRASRSHESLLMSPTSMHSIDLASSAVEIKPLHSSILGQEHCFQVSTNNGTKYYSCKTIQEQQQWIQRLRQTVKPDQEQCRRRENSLKLWVLEAKNVAPKKRYFCEVCLDKTLYARTSSKNKGDMLFWGEQFDFNNLPAVEQITINLYREPDKKKKKEKNVLLGYVPIPVSEISGRHLVERWHSSRSAVVGKAGKESRNELPVIRIKARYQSVEILPMAVYEDLKQYVQTEYQVLVEVLEPVLAVRAKEELATSLVHILQKTGQAQDFLTDIVMAEVRKLDNENLAFRGNSIATKAVEAYMKLVGEKYLQDTLSDLIRTVLDSSEDLEVDPMRVAGSSVLEKHRENLKKFCEIAWYKIINSHCTFPSELRSVFSALRQCCEGQDLGDISEKLISSCIFLRLLCPAILSPSLFNLTQEFPQAKAARNLTLIAKTVQSLANSTLFGAKEEFMTFMNGFVEREMGSMKSFIHQISTPRQEDLSLEFTGYIDLGLELSLLHTQLVEHEEKLSESCQLRLSKLSNILDQLTKAIDNPDLECPAPSAPSVNSMRLYDNVRDGLLADQNANGAACGPRGFVRVNPTTRLNPARLQPGVTQTHVPSQPLVQDLGEDNLVVSSFESCALSERCGPAKSAPLHSQVEAERVNQSWNKILTAANVVNGEEIVDLISFMDDLHSEDPQNSSAELDNGDGMSVGQFSTIASSGYQSFGYSQSSSPVESVMPNEVGSRPAQRQPLEFSNPVYGHSSPPSSSKVCRSSSVSSMSSEEGSRRGHQKSNSTSSHVVLTSKSSTLASGSRPVFTSTIELSRGMGYGSSVPQSSPMTAHSMLLLMSPSEQRLPASSLVSSDLSKSANIPPPTDAAHPSMKRTVTDSVLVQKLSPGSPQKLVPGSPDGSEFSTIVYGPQRQPPAIVGQPQQPQPVVRMGVRSVQRKVHEPDKSKVEYEQELTLLRQQLGETQTMLEATRQRLQTEAEAKINLETDLQNRLQETEVRLHQQQKEKDSEMKHMMTKLMMVEKERHREQTELQSKVHEKDKLIEMQEHRIQSLDSANNRLLTALSQLKEKCQIQGCNGLASSPVHSRSALAMENGGQLKGSPC